MAATQKALFVTEVGKPLTEVTRPIPVPKEGQILIKITTSGINPHDQKIRDYGLFVDMVGGLPILPVNDIAGIVTSLGAGVTSFKVGDRVFGQSMLSHDTGGLQQYALLQANVTAKIPEGFSDDDATTLPVNGIAPFVALFHHTGMDIPPPFPGNERAKSFDYASQKVVVIGGGSNCGKLGVQFAALAGIGTIIAVASKSNEATLKRYGATHFIDRYASNEEIKAQVQNVTGDDLVYVLDPINRDFTLAASLLSSTKQGTFVSLLPGGVDETKIGEKKAGYRHLQTFGDSHSIDFASEFWKNMPDWMMSGKIKPMDFKVIPGGFSADGVNKVMDDHRDGKYPGKWHFHPNA